MSDKLMMPVIRKFPKYAELIYCAAVMRGGKSAKMLADRFSDNQVGLKTLIIKPSKDDRDGEFINEWGIMTSRQFPGQEFPAYYTQKIDAKFVNKILLTPSGKRRYHRIFIDEVQFFAEKDIDFLAREIVYKLKIPVKCYGLKVDINKGTFPATAKLLAAAHHVFEIPYSCELGCGRIATAHLRYINGKLDLSKKSVAVEKGGTTYLSVCNDCWDAVKSHHRVVKFR